VYNAGDFSQVLKSIIFIGLSTGQILETNLQLVSRSDEGLCQTSVKVLGAVLDVK
jgi:hypothetical protein